MSGLGAKEFFFLFLPSLLECQAFAGALCNPNEGMWHRGATYLHQVYKVLLSALDIRDGMGEMKKVFMFRVLK